jgi:putative membrane fusion protein
VLPKVTGALTRDYTVQYGRLQTMDKTTGYFVRKEKVYLADRGGIENRYIEQGALVRKGVKVMDINGNGNDQPQMRYKNILEKLGSSAIRVPSYKTQSEGIVSYYVDGYEGELTPAAMKKKSERYYRNLGNGSIMKLESGMASTGDPLFKVTDRSAWYIVCFVPGRNLKRYKIGNKVSVRINQEKTIEGTVYYIKRIKYSSDVMLIVKTNYYYYRFDSTRVAEVNVITSDAMGLIIYNSSICRKKGQPGVYVQQKTGEYKFTRIKVLSTDGRQSVISKSRFTDKNGKSVKTVNNYDDVLRHGRNS